MRKVRLKRACEQCEWPSVVDVDEDDEVKCWRGETGVRSDEVCNASCAAFRVQDGHVYCLALPNAFVPAFAIGELAEDGAE